MAFKEEFDFISPAGLRPNFEERFSTGHFFNISPLTGLRQENM